MRSVFAIYTQEIEDCVMEKIREYLWSEKVQIYVVFINPRRHDYF